MEKEKVKLRIYGMTCDDCAATVSDALRGQDGVLEVKVSLKERSGEVTFDPEKLRREDLLKNKVFGKPSHYSAIIDEQ